MNKLKLYTEFTVLFVLGCCSVLAILVGSLMMTRVQHFALLAQSFLHGKLYFTRFPWGVGDMALYEGRYYWPLGPLPAILLMPFVWVANRLGATALQGHLSMALVAVSAWMIYRIAQRIGFTSKHAAYCTLAFVGGSAYFYVAAFPKSWYFAQVVAVVFILLSLHEYYFKRRWWMIGIAMGLVILTRLNTGLMAVFFILEIFHLLKAGKERRLALIQVAIPIAASVMLLGLYNDLRFGNPFEQGYHLQYLRVTALAANRAAGFVSLVHLPTNLYYLFLAVPDPVLKNTMSHILAPPYLSLDRWGTGMFFTSPYFFYLFRIGYRNRFSLHAWITVCIIALPILLYYGIGYIQYGYRYSLDFLPLLFILLMRNYYEAFGQLSLGLRMIIVTAVLVDFSFVFHL